MRRGFVRPRSARGTGGLVRGRSGSRRPGRGALRAGCAVLAAAFLHVASPASAQNVPAPAQAQEGDRGPGVRLVAVPAVGASFNEREARLPVSPTAFVRIALEVWSAVGGAEFALFLGGASTGVMVNESCSVEDACAGATQLAADFVATGEAGLIFGIPGEPYLVGFWGQGFPAKADPFNPYAPNASRRYRRFSWGGGVGIAPRIGALSLSLEVRFRRDGRFAQPHSDSFEVLFGVPLRSR